MMNNCCSSPSDDDHDNNSMLCVERMNHHHHHHHGCYNQHHLTLLVVPSSCPKYTHPSSPNTQIFIKTLSGKTMTLLVDLKKDTVLSVKEKIYQKTNIPALKQRLIHRQLQLEDHKKLSDYSTIDKDSTFHLVLRLVAGVGKSSSRSASKKTSIKTEELLLDSTTTTSDNTANNNQIILSTTTLPSTTTTTNDSTIPKPDRDDDGETSSINISSTTNNQHHDELVTTSSNDNNTTTTSTGRKSRSKSKAKKPSKKSTEIKVKEEPMESSVVLLASSSPNFQSSPSENSTSPSSSTNNPSSNSNALETHSDDDESESDEDDDSDDDSDSGCDEDGNKSKGKRSSKNKKRGSYTKRACINCRTAHAACDSGRPCKRCIQLGKADSCRDAERKRTKKRTLNEYENAPVFFPSLDSFIPLLSGLQAPPLEPAIIQKSDDTTSNMSTTSESSERKVKDEFTPKTTTRIKKEKESKRKSKSSTSNNNGKKRMDVMEISQQQPEKPLNSELAEIFAPDTAHSTFLDMESSPTTEQDVQMFFNDEDISLSKRDHHLSEAFNSGVVLSPSCSSESQTLVVGGAGAGEEVITTATTGNPSTALALIPNNSDNQQLISILQSYHGTLPFDLTEAISQSNNNEIVKMLLYEYLRQSQELSELKSLVTSLQITLINLNPPQFSPSPNSSASTTLNDISNNTM